MVCLWVVTVLFCKKLFQEMNTIHYAGSAVSFDWSVKSFMMVVYENLFFFKFS